jgi:hypothetical protein
MILDMGHDAEPEEQGAPRGSQAPPDAGLLPSAPSVVRDVTGEMRAVEQAWPDGSYSCPFCGAAVLPSESERPCPNPQCAANPRMDPETVLRRRQEHTESEQRAQDERARWARISESMLREREGREQEVSEAEEAGYCTQCFIRSGHRRRVRHRTPDYHAARGN